MATTINGARFKVFDISDVGMSQGMDGEVYSNLYEGKCYELSIRIATVARGVYNLSGTEKQFREEDQKAVRDRLEESLYSLDFLSKIIATKAR